MSNDGDKTPRRRQGAATVASAGDPPKSSDILREIFLRLPPLPSSLPRVSIVCKRWRRLVANPDFLLRFHANHRKAPLLGLFNYYEDTGRLYFTPVLDPPDRIPSQRLSMKIDNDSRSAETFLSYGKLLGCRHGRILVLNPRNCEVLVCDPITRDQRHIALPQAFNLGYIYTYMAKGAVLCADHNEGHVHGTCHASPFKVVLVHLLYQNHKGYRAIASVYSSETGIWSNLISAPEQCRSTCVDFHRPSTLVGCSLYWWLRSSYCHNMEILEFHIGSQSLSVIHGPPLQKLSIYCSQIVQGEDGGVGVAVLSYPSLQIWDWKVNNFGGEAAKWVLRKTVKLKLVPNTRATGTKIVGYVEDDDAILIDFNRDDIFIVQLESSQSNKLCESIGAHIYHPFTSFYSSGEFGRCKGIATVPSTSPAIEPSKQQAPTPPVRKKARTTSGSPA